MTDYLSAEKRAQVEAMKQRIRAGVFNTPSAGFVTAESTTVSDLIAQAVYQDEQGPWSLEDPHTEREIAQYELALAAHDAEVRASVLAEQGEPEWEYGQSEVLEDGTIAFGAPVETLEEAIRRRDIDRVNYPWPQELGVGRRRKAGPWEPVEENTPHTEGNER